MPDLKNPVTPDYQLLFRSLAGFHLVLAPDARLLAASDSLLMALHQSFEALVGCNITEIFSLHVPAVDLAGWEETLQKTILHQQPQTLTLNVLPEAPFGPAAEPPPLKWRVTHKPVSNTSHQLAYLLLEICSLSVNQLVQSETLPSGTHPGSFYKNTGEIVWQWHVPSTTAWFNQNYTQLLGYPVTSPFLEWTNYLHPTDKPSVLTNLTTAFREHQEQLTHEYRLRHADGHYLDMLDRGYIQYDPKTGVPARVVGTLTDITATKQAERQLKDSLDQFRFLAETVPAFIWTTDEKGHTIYQNQQFYDFTGYTPAQMVGHQWTTIIHPEDVPATLTAWHAAVAAGQDFEVTHRIRRKDGVYRWLLARARVMRHEQGHIIRWIGASTDIDDQKKIEEQLEQSHQKFQFLTELIPQLTWTSNAHGQVDYFNQRWLEYTGLSLPESLENKWVQAIHPDDRAAAKKRWLTCLVTGENPEIEYRIRRYDGVYHWFLLRAAPLRNPQGVILKWFGTCTDIHGRKENQELLEQSNTHFRYLAESLPQLVWTTDATGKPDYFNDRWRQLAGLSNIPPNWNWSTLIHPEDKDRVISLGRQLVKEGKICEMEYRLQNAAGNYRWFLARAIPLRDESGAITKWIGTATDIQEIVQIREQLQENANQLHTVLDALPQMTWTARPDGSLNYYSERWFEYLDTTFAELQEWGWTKFIHPDDLEVGTQAWLNSIATGEPFITENRWRGKDGQYRWFLVRALPVRKNNGDIMMWVGSHTNIHNQKQARQRLEESNQRFRFLTEIIPQIVWTAEPDGATDYFNQNWYDFTGQTNNSLGWGWEQVLHPDDVATTNQVWRKAIATGHDYEIEYRFNYQNTGQYRWFLARARAMRNASGQIVKWFGTCTDIQEQKQIEQLLLSKNEELKKINEDLDRFVYTASHDLKLPIINMASIFDELKQTAIYQDPEADKLIGLFQQALQQIYGTINDLSEIGKFQKNVYNTVEQVHLATLTDEVKASIQDSITTSGAQITTDYSEIPYLPFSKVNLKSIIYNLLSNAIKYQVPGRKPVILLQSYVYSPEYLALCITDNGLGIDLEKHQGKLFQMYKRLHNHVPGSGLGLYIIHRIMTNNKGSIQVESTVNEGTTFRLLFPHTTNVPA